MLYDTGNPIAYEEHARAKTMANFAQWQRMLVDDAASDPLEYVSGYDPFRIRNMIHLEYVI